MVFFWAVAQKHIISIILSLLNRSLLSRLYFSIVLQFHSYLSGMAPPKNFCYIFVLGIHFLSFVAIQSIKELFEILSEGPQLVILHEQSDDRMSHLHVVFAVGEPSRHAKVQLFMRYLCSFIKDSIKNRFGLINHLKLSNIPCTDFDVEKLACSLYCHDKTTHNAENLTDVTD